MSIVLVEADGRFHSSVAVVSPGGDSPANFIPAVVVPPVPQFLVPVLKAATAAQLTPFQSSAPGKDPAPPTPKAAVYIPIPSIPYLAVFK